MQPSTSWMAFGLFLATAPMQACAASPSAAPSGDAGAGPDGMSTHIDGSADAPLAMDAGVTTLSLPQFLHGKALVDTTAFPQIAVVVAVVAASGATHGSVTVSVDGKPPVAATTGTAGFTAMLDVKSLAAGPHTITATATSNGVPTGTVTGTLIAQTGSVQFTSFAKVGPAYASHLVPSPAGDTLGFTWVSAASGKHQLYLNYLDGAFGRTLPADAVLNAPGDEPLTGYTAFSADAIGAVYNTADPAGGHWLVKMHIVDLAGIEKVPVIDLTGADSAFSLAQAGVDPGGFSAAWLDIRPPADGGALPPLEVRFARYDMTAGKLVGPVTLDADQPQAAGSTQGPQSLETLGELGIACNTKICLVSYTRDVYNAFVDLDIPKLFLATVDLATGQPVGAPVGVETSDWDTQLFGHHLVTLADGSFLLVYTANDTATAVNPVTACDSMLERDLLFAVKIDAAGKLQGAPAPIFDHEGSREYPRVAQHPDGFALFWEDQRSLCAAAGGHIAMAMNVASPSLATLLDPYLEAPGSIVLPPEDPTLTVTGTNFEAAWSDNRHGNGLAMPESEIYLDTYWRN